METSVANLGIENLLHRLRNRLAIGEPSLLPALRHVIDPIAKEERSRSNEEKSLCLIDGKNEAIGSHVIPDSYLRRLKEGGIAPTTPLMTKGGTVKLLPMGGKTEPVFPGYCNPCDTRLFPWERRHSFGGANAVALQLMRTADAFAHEYQLRARILGKISRAAAASDEIMNVLVRLDPATRERFAQEISSLEVASGEVAEFHHEISGLAEALRNTAGLSSRSKAAAHVRQVTVQTTPELQLADVAWGPRDDVANVEDHVPVAVTLLAEDDRTHLLLGSTADGASLVDRIVDHIEATPSHFFAYGLHWLLRGTNYWFAKPSFLTNLEDRDVTKLKAELEFNRFIQASFAPGAGPERTPIIRPGNGWT